MGFEKKWTDEQNKRILEIKDKSEIETLAKEFNVTPKIISQRIYYLNGKEKTRLKKEKAKLNAEKKNNSSSKAKSDTSSEISVSEVSPKEEADEMQNKYLDNTSQETSENSNEAIREGSGDSTQSPSPKSTEEISSVQQVNWSGVSGTITHMLDLRFKNNGLTPFSDEEKELFDNAISEVLRIRAQLLMKNADLINLGLATFVVLMPRITEFLDRKKQNKNPPTRVTSQEVSSNVGGNILIPNPAEVEKERAMKEFQEKSMNGTP